MKNNSIAILLIAIVAFGYLFSFAASADPGTETDPLVSRSYVDQRINEVMRVLNSTGGAPAVTQEQSTGGGDTKFKPVMVEIGKIIYGGEGCEMIMRTGSGYIVTSTDTVVNATSGTELKNGVVAPLNSMLIFPRDDGRGVKVTNNTWFLVKGSYTVR